MQTPVNHFKHALATGNTQIGLWLALADGYAAELCAGSGFDWLLLDGEHAPHDLRSLLSALQAVAPYPAHPVVRLPHGDTALIKQVLEIGATTLLIPMVESAEQARQLVRAVRYPPSGIRGVGSGIGRSSRWTRYGDYLQQANDRICLLVQVESAAALEQLDDIARVDGVDGVFIGPADLSASMGFLGQPAHPQVRAAIDAAIAAIRAAGKAPGILCTDQALARHYLELGARFVAVGVDTSLLVQATTALAGAFKRNADRGAAGRAGSTGSTGGGIGSAADTGLVDGAGRGTRCAADIASGTHAGADSGMSNGASRAADDAADTDAVGGTRSGTGSGAAPGADASAHPDLTPTARGAY